MMCLTFMTSLTAQTAATKIWYNYLISYADNLERKVGNPENRYFLSELQGMSESTVSGLMAYGYTDGVLNPDIPTGCCYVMPKQCEGLSKWWFVDVDASLKSGVVGATQEQYDPNWEP